MDDDQFEPAQQAAPDRPAEPVPAVGGSFVRERDGGLKAVAATQPAPERAHVEPGYQPAADQSESE